MVNSSATIVDWVERHAWLSPLVYWIVKKTFFKQFVAGEDKKESILTLRRNRELGMGTILNYSGTISENPFVCGFLFPKFFSILYKTRTLMLAHAFNFDLSLSIFWIVRLFSGLPELTE